MSAETRSSDRVLGNTIVFLKSLSSSSSSVKSVGRWCCCDYTIILRSIERFFCPGLLSVTEDSTVSINVLRNSHVFGFLC